MITLMYKRNIALIFIHTHFRVYIKISEYFLKKKNKAPLFRMTMHVFTNLLDNPCTSKNTIAWISSELENNARSECRGFLKHNTSKFIIIWKKRIYVFV